MSEEINYPIKYAVLELKERGGWAVNYENITQGFIVSKCYVIESNLEYHSNGSNKITHKVVFPFEDISCLRISLLHGQQNIGKENIPNYDARNKPYPIRIVSELFEFFEAAKTVAEEKNAELNQKLILQVSMTNTNWKKQYATLNQEFNRKLELCYLFEQLVLKATENMKISESYSTGEKEPFIRVLSPSKKKV